jgi:hypothetical protein
VHANAFSQPHALVVLWAQVPMEIGNGCCSMLSGSVRSLMLSTLRCSAAWGILLQQWHLPPVIEMVGQAVMLAAIWAMEQGRKRVRSSVHTHPILAS